MSRIILKKGDSIERSDLYCVALTLQNGKKLEPLEPRRLFPLSAPDTYVSLLNESGEEVALIRDLSLLDRPSRKAVQDCLAEYYLVPKILRVTAVEDQYGLLVWFAETDRGQVKITIKNRQSDIKHFKGTSRILVRDEADNRYEIENFDALDAKTRHLLFSYV